MPGSRRIVASLETRHCLVFYWACVTSAGDRRYLARLAWAELGGRRSSKKDLFKASDRR